MSNTQKVHTTMRVFVYQNRPDDIRPRSQMHFCKSCGGWYGVPHTDYHCRTGSIARWRPEDCACRFCKVHTGQSIDGGYGFWTEAREWQP